MQNNLFPSEPTTNTEPQNVSIEMRSNFVRVFLAPTWGRFHTGHWTLTPPVTPQPRETTMTNAEIRAAAVEYVAMGKADYAQSFTSPGCGVWPQRATPVSGGTHWTYVQVWVAVPTKDLVVLNRAEKETK